MWQEDQVFAALRTCCGALQDLAELATRGPPPRVPDQVEGVMPLPKTEEKKPSHKKEKHKSKAHKKVKKERSSSEESRKRAPGVKDTPALASKRKRKEEGIEGEIEPKVSARSSGSARPIAPKKEETKIEEESGEEEEEEEDQEDDRSLREPDGRTPEIGTDSLTAQELHRRVNDFVAEHPRHYDLYTLPERPSRAGGIDSHSTRAREERRVPREPSHPPPRRSTEEDRHRREDRSLSRRRPRKKKSKGVKHRERGWHRAAAQPQKQWRRRGW